MEELVILASAFLASFIQSTYASCPTQADLAHGIVLEDQRRNYAIVYYLQEVETGLEEESLIASTWRSPVFSSSWNQYAIQGLMGRIDVPKDAPSWNYQIYTDDLDLLFPIAEGKSVSFQGMRVNGEGERWVTDYRVSVDAPEALSIGECTYEVFPLNFSTAVTRPDQTVKQFRYRSYYSPELKYVLDSSRSSQEPGFEAIRPRLWGEWWPFEE